jgi:hypothetical protein
MNIKFGGVFGFFIFVVCMYAITAVNTYTTAQSAAVRVKTEATNTAKIDETQNSSTNSRSISNTTTKHITTEITSKTQTGVQTSAVQSQGVKIRFDKNEAIMNSLPLKKKSTWTANFYSGVQTSLENPIDKSEIFSTPQNVTGFTVAKLLGSRGAIELGLNFGVGAKRFLANRSFTFNAKIVPVKFGAKRDMEIESRTALNFTYFERFGSTGVVLRKTLSDERKGVIVKPFVAADFHFPLENSFLSGTKPGFSYSSGLDFRLEGEKVLVDGQASFVASNVFRQSYGGGNQEMFFQPTNINNLWSGKYQFLANTEVYFGYRINPIITFGPVFRRTVIINGRLMNPAEQSKNRTDFGIIMKFGPINKKL